MRRGDLARIAGDSCPRPWIGFTRSPGSSCPIRAKISTDRLKRRTSRIPSLEIVCDKDSWPRVPASFAGFHFNFKARYLACFPGERKPRTHPDLHDCVARKLEPANKGAGRMDTNAFHSILVPICVGLGKAFLGIAIAHHLGAIPFRHGNGSTGIARRAIAAGGKRSRDKTDHLWISSTLKSVPFH